MVKTDNKLIKAWQLGISLIVLGLDKKDDPTETVKYMAESQLKQIENGRPNQNENPTEQMNEEQKECYEYLKKVAETGEF